MELYRVSHLTFGYYPYEEKTGECAMEPVEILHDLSFTVEEGGFVLLCGATGCGKSTLLRLLKKELQPKGRLSGEILFAGKTFEEWEDRETAAGIGFVMQNPNDQCVTDKVWHEMAFGLENLGVPSSEIRRRVAEISAYFGIDEWYEKKVEELSGGQKQILNLASVMVMNPRVLILDEPTAQLDPIAAQNFLNMLYKLNKELGITVILAEHGLEETFSMASHVLVLEQGKIVTDEKPRQAAVQVPETAAIYRALPEAVRLFRHFETAVSEKAASEKAASETVASETEVSEMTASETMASEIVCPLTIGEGRNYLQAHLKTEKAGAAWEASKRTDANDAKKREIPVLELKDVWFRYDKQGPDILKGTSLQLYAGEILCLLGSNGSGKSTVLKILAGICKPQEGKLLIYGRHGNGKRSAGSDGKQKGKTHADPGRAEVIREIGYLPQDVETLFVTDTVEKELSLVGCAAAEQEIWSKRADCHPYDLSGGEKQLLGMTKVLAGNKTILLLDESTKGLDASAKETIRQRLMEEKQKGTAILLVTHDLEFAAACADRCGLFFRGKLVSVEETKSFFRENRFYTTTASRIAKGYNEHVVTSQELYDTCRKERKEK